MRKNNIESNKEPETSVSELPRQQRRLAVHPGTDVPGSFLVFIFTVLCSTVWAESGTGEPIDIVFSEVENDKEVGLTSAVAKHTFYPQSSMYVVHGKVRYKNVEGDAYLEMWNVMPDGARYFSRTLAEEGPMRKISGSSDWRDFELPFNLMDHKPEYVDLEINVVMPGKGMIELKSLTISDVYPGAAREWFGDRTAGWVGGIAGSVCGIYGGLLGIFGGILVPRGKGRRWLLGTVLVGVAAGILSLLLGLSALCFGQPWHVWYPFVLVGGISVFVLTSLFFMFRKGYAQAELRKMQALDV